MGEPVKVTAGMKFGTYNSKLKEMQEHAAKIGGKVQEEVLKYGKNVDICTYVVDKNGKDTNGTLWLEFTRGSYGDNLHILYNSVDGKYQFSGEGATFTEVRTSGKNPSIWIKDSNGNGIVDPEELK